MGKPGKLKFKLEVNQKNLSKTRKIWDNPRKLWENWRKIGDIFMKIMKTSRTRGISRGNITGGYVSPVWVLQYVVGFTVVGFTVISTVIELQSNDEKWHRDLETASE